MTAQYYLFHPKGRLGRICFSLQQGGPAITEISSGMQRILGAGDGEERWLHAVMREPALLLPEGEEQQLFGCIRQIRETGEPALFTGRLLSCCRQALPVVGIIERHAQETYLVLVYDCRNDLKDQANALREHLVKVWKNCCEWMTEFDLNAGVSRCLYARGRDISGVWAQLENTLVQRIERLVSARDRDRLRAFFRTNMRRDNTTADYSEITFGMLGANNRTRPFRGVLIGLGCGSFIFCGIPDGAPGAGRHDGARRPARKRNYTDHGHLVEIVTFGAFNIVVDGVPVFFRHEKAQELLALLVDRRGSYATAQSLISFLWEDESASERTYSRLRKVAMRLKDTLCAYDIGDILECVSGRRRIVPEKVNCDLYDYLSRDRAEHAPPRANYLPEYSWSEFTHGELAGAAREE